MEGISLPRGSRNRERRKHNLKQAPSPLWSNDPDGMTRSRKTPTSWVMLKFSNASSTPRARMKLWLVRSIMRSWANLRRVSYQKSIKRLSPCKDAKRTPPRKHSSRTKSWPKSTKIGVMWRICARLNLKSLFLALQDLERDKRIAIV